MDFVREWKTVDERLLGDIESLPLVYFHIPQRALELHSPFDVELWEFIKKFIDRRPRICATFALDM